jgi:hypothetical protein
MPNLTEGSVLPKGDQLILAEKDKFRSWLSEIKVGKSQLLQLLSKREYLRASPRSGVVV